MNFSSISIISEGLQEDYEKFGRPAGNPLSTDSLEYRNQSLAAQRIADSVADGATDVQHLVYSSCNADSLARDLAAMPGWRPVRGRLFAMFPQTTHHEVLVQLARG